MSDVTEAFEPSAQTDVPPQKSSRGCLYGCLFVVVGGLALMVCAGVGSYWWVTAQVKKYTSATPAELPLVEYTPEELGELETRVSAFTEAIDEGETPEEDLELSAEDINALIANDDTMRGKVFIRIEDGQVSGDVSIPTDAIPGGKGRYFNGSASFDVSMDDGVLIVILADAEVKGEKLPQEAIDALANENLAKEIYKDPKNAKVLRKFENITVEGDKIILKIRRDAGEKDADAKDGGEEAGSDATDTEDSKEATTTELSDGESTESEEAAVPESSTGEDPPKDD